MRKFIAIIVAVMMLLMLSSCGISSLFDIDFDNYGKVAKTEDGWLIYQENKYYPTQEYLFDMSRNTEEDIELGWVFYGSPASAYYFSNTDENPMYIVRNIDEFVWVREDFDYTEDLFVIKDTDIEILFSEAFTGNTMKISTLESHQEKASFIWHSKTVSELEIYARIYEYNDVWYMKTRTSEWWEISDDFLNLLLENKTISIE